MAKQRCSDGTGEQPWQLQRAAADNRLLSDMKRSGIQPIAVWDERGVREWKAPEVSHPAIFLTGLELDM